MYSLQYKGTIHDTIVITEDYTLLGTFVPKGYHSDGFTFKFFLFRLFLNKFSPRYMPCVVVHDRDTDLALAVRRIDKEAGNQLFREADIRFKATLKMANRDKTNYKTNVAHWVVVVYHKLRYGA